MMPSSAFRVGLEAATDTRVAFSYQSLVDQMDAAIAAGLTDTHCSLYAGGSRDDGSLIGTWRYNGTGYEPIGPVDLSLVTASSVAIVDTGGGGTDVNVVTVVSAASLAVGDLITIWDVSAGAALATSREITDITGADVTFDGAAVTVGDADLVHVEGTCEFGELRDAGYWVPTAGTTAYWVAAGLHVQGTGDWSGVLLKIASIVGPPRNISINARWNVTDTAAGDGSAYGLGASDGVTAYGGCNKNSTGTWGRHGFWGTIGSTFSLGSSASSTGSPDGLTGIHTPFQAADNVGAGTVRWSQHVQHASLTPSFGAGIGNSLYSLLSYDSDVSALLFLCKTITSGALSAVATECRFTAEEA